MVLVSDGSIEYSAAGSADLARSTADFPEIVELYRMRGDADSLMKVVVANIAGYDRFYKRLIGAVKLSDVSSAFAMEQIKYSTALPLGN